MGTKRHTLGERFDTLDRILEKLPLGYGYEITFGTDGTQPPEMTVKIQGEYDEFLKQNKVHSCSARTDYHEEKDFKNLIQWTQQTVDSITNKNKPASEKKNSSEDESDYTPF